jgi:hypothetical protein
VTPPCDAGADVEMQDVEGAVGAGLGHGSDSSLSVGHVALERARHAPLAGDRLHRLRRRRTALVHDQNLRPFAGVEDRRRLAVAHARPDGASARHQHALALKAHHLSTASGSASTICGCQTSRPRIATCNKTKGMIPR